MPGRRRWEEDTRPSGLLVAESEPEHDGSPGLADRDPRSARRVFGAFVQRRQTSATATGWLQTGEVLRGRRVLRARVIRPRVIRPRVIRPRVVRCRHAGKFEGGG